MKKILIVFAGLAVIAVIALYLLVGNLDKILKGAIEGAGSELLGVPVTVASVASALVVLRKLNHLDLVGALKAPE